MTLDYCKYIIHCNTSVHRPSTKVFLSFFLLFYSTAIFAAQEPTSDNMQVSDSGEAIAIDQILDNVIGEDPSIIYTSSPKEATSEFASGSGINLGLGRKNNVLEDYNDFHDSNFSYIFADVFFSWRNANNNELFIATHLENTDYIDIDTEGSEQQVFAILKGKKIIADISDIGIQLIFDYQQSLDSRNTFLNQTVPVTISHEISVRPFWKIIVTKEIYAVTEIGWSSNSAELADDRYENVVLSAAVKKKYGFDSEILIMYDASRFVYEEADALALDESPIQGNTLVLDSHSIILSNKHYWNQSTQCNLESSLLYELQKDNGVGYDDFSYYAVSETLHYQGIYWILTGSIEISNYLYRKRRVQVSNSKSEMEYSRLIGIDIELARSVGNGYSIITGLEMIRNISNNKKEDYSSSSMIIKAEKTF